jgi:hypothetical protein
MIIAGGERRRSFAMSRLLLLRRLRTFICSKISRARRKSVIHADSILETRDTQHTKSDIHVMSPRAVWRSLRETCSTVLGFFQVKLNSPLPQEYRIQILLDQVTLFFAIPAIWRHLQLYLRLCARAIPRSLRRLFQGTSRSRPRTCHTRPANTLVARTKSPRRKCLPVS